MLVPMSPMDEDEVRYFQYNKIYVIESTPTNERQTGKELFNDLLNRATDQYDWFMCSYKYVETREQLFRWLATIRRDVLAGGIYPLLHFEAHGNRIGLEVGKGDRQVIVKWQEIADELRKINVLTRNNLMVSVATCYGSYIFQGIDPGQRAPFFGFVAPLEEINSDEIIGGYYEFYERIIRTKEFDQAVLALRGGVDGAPIRFTYQHCEAAMRFAMDGLGTTMRDPVYRKQKALALTVRSLSNINVRLNHTIPGIVDYYNNFVSQSDKHLQNMQDFFLMKDLQDPN
jgi:hypothetical protein